jgi:hypothetical protein
MSDKEIAVCTDDHNNGQPCPVHGYDPSLPAPAGYRYHRYLLPNGQERTDLIADTN